jgi:hypothetical protein
MAGMKGAKSDFEFLHPLSDFPNLKFPDLNIDFFTGQIYIATYFLRMHDAKSLPLPLLPHA